VAENPFDLLERVEHLTQRTKDTEPTPIDHGEYAMLIDRLGESVRDLLVRLRDHDLVKVAAQSYGDDGEPTSDDDPLFLPTSSIEMLNCHDVVIGVNVTAAVEIGEETARRTIEGAEEALATAREASILEDFESDMLADLGTLSFLRSQRGARTRGTRLRERIETLQANLAPRAAAILERLMSAGLIALSGPDEEMIQSAALAEDGRRVVLGTTPVTLAGKRRDSGAT
jgi:hypothetical protein